MLTPFPRSMRIGALLIDPPLVLAPMAGITHVAFRELVRGFGGCGLFFSEMLSCRAVPRETPERSFYVARLSGQRPFFYQILGKDPAAMAQAIAHLEQTRDEAGNPPDGFDINMGCGAPRIRSDGEGSGLLRNPEQALAVVAACRRVTLRPLTVKMRLGWEEDFGPLVRLARRLEAAGADAITLHPRLAKEKFRRRARWQYVGMLKAELGIPVIGNGDIHTREDVVRRMAETGCDGVMIGRAAVRKPWLFREMSSGEGRGEPIELPAVYGRFLELLAAHIPPERRLGRLKEFTHYFAANFRYGHHLAYGVQNTGSVDDAQEQAARFFARHADECMYRPPDAGYAASSS